ncbi:DUF1707 domain-containing protein [Streptomyces sp. NPDC051561]|uniref:DUF1707 domain-containing protein n=1 Tax=Streptomyces sp. NPDC051561 TaxID=3365658 RepID=UPI0037A4E2E5
MTAEPAATPARKPLRASDADREVIVEQLREAAAEGRIDLEELDERLGLALGAKTVAELGPLVEDLVPEGHDALGLVAPSAGEPLVLKGGMYGAVREGRWQVPSRIVAHAGMAGVRIDFTRAEVRLREIEVEVYGEMAGVTLVVPEGWGLDAEGLEPGAGKLRDRTVGEREPGAPLIRLVGTPGMAGVVVRHRNALERRKIRREQG